MQNKISDDEEVLLAEQLKALAHPVRLQILQSLGNRDNCCCNDLCVNIPLAQSTISQHLKVLNKAGIIDYQPVGNCSHYSLNAATLARAIRTLTKLGEIAGISDSCPQTGVSEHETRAELKPRQKVDHQ